MPNEVKTLLEEIANKNINITLYAIPDGFRDSITLDFFQDPVRTADGQTYERVTIERWLKENDTSPNTGMKLTNKTLTPNQSLKNSIVEFLIVVRDGKIMPAPNATSSASSSFFTPPKSAYGAPYKLTPEQKKELFNMYGVFLKEHNHSEASWGSALSRDLHANLYDQQDKEEYFMQCMDKIYINVNFDTIKRFFQQYKIIVLRAPSGENHLLVGCGNDPLITGTDSGEHNHVPESWDMGMGEQWKNKHLDRHAHPNCYTVDPDIFMNPSVVAFFGVENVKLSNLFKEYKKTFSTVVLEAVNPLADKKETVHGWCFDFFPPNFEVINMRLNGELEINEKTGPAALEGETEEAWDELENNMYGYATW